MVNHKKLEQELNQFMKITDYRDIVHNGLQVEGKEEIRSVLTATSATEEVIEKATGGEFDAIFVHHGWFWPNENRVIRDGLKRKLKRLLTNEINLYAYHLPLDGLDDYGNNHPVLKDLHCSNIEKFTDVGYTGELPSPMRLDDFFLWLDDHYQTKGVHIRPPRLDEVQKVAIVSGQGTSFFSQAIETGCDAFITGEGTEWVYSLSMENQVSYSALGHHKTEEIGPKLMAGYLSERFELKTEFFRVNNPF